MSVVWPDPITENTESPAWCSLAELAELSIQVTKRER